MITILLPAMGASSFFKDSFFPKPLYEINGKTMLEMVVEDYDSIELKKYVFVFSEEDCQKFHLDDSVRILSSTSNVIKLRNQTSGALCTCLMAIEYIDKDEPLIIANSDQVIDVNYNSVISYFENIDADAGLITFPNVHPRWSYARKKVKEVVEVAEKRPLSKDAIAGFYYFKKGEFFIESAKNALRKKSNLEGRYYISSSVNELILLGKRVSFYDIEKVQYKSFYSPQKIKEFEEVSR